MISRVVRKTDFILDREHTVKKSELCAVYETYWYWCMLGGVTRFDMKMCVGESLGAETAAASD